MLIRLQCIKFLLFCSYIQFNLKDISFVVLSLYFNVELPDLNFTIMNIKSREQNKTIKVKVYVNILTKL